MSGCIADNEVSHGDGMGSVVFEGSSMPFF